MSWDQLLSAHRLGCGELTSSGPGVSDFQRDYDRIVFSSAFRRLQDKTQIFPLAENDYVRTRLTHSIEVSCIGRELGMLVGKDIYAKYHLTSVTPADFGAIVAAGCLAHDIGNPPFGHSGEDAIRQWFTNSEIAGQVRKNLTEPQRKDFERYEGNAQGFRLVTRLQMERDRGGMQLTFATLGALTKYPIESHIEGGKSGYPGVSAKKFGFFQSEKECFGEVAKRNGLIARKNRAAWWCRHPLAFLVEAADDICYRLIDFEDGYRLGLVSYNEIYDRLFEIDSDRKGKNKKRRTSKIESHKERIEYLRGVAIHQAASRAAMRFLENEPKILTGDFDDHLLDKTTIGNRLTQIKKRSSELIYSDRRVLEIEAAGFEVLGGLLDIFVGSANEAADKQDNASYRSKKVLELVPDQFIGPKREVAKDGYTRVIKMLDFVSGMTDSYAVSLYKKLKGISLPGQ